MTTPGERVGALMGSTEETMTVRFFGYGVYAGDFLRPGAGPPWSESDIAMVAKIMDEHDAEPFEDGIAYRMLHSMHADGKYTDEELAHELDEAKRRQEQELARPREERIDDSLRFFYKNPRIDLDNGETVWGCECWWGPEDQIKANLEQYEAAGYTIEQVSIDELRAQGMRSAFMP